jgi:hypothetical protein
MFKRVPTFEKEKYRCCSPLFFVLPKVLKTRGQHPAAMKTRGETERNTS